ncbi:uncharacterized protein LOC131707094 isoform X2 [Acipenser ruthenus]|uniref:uncharacterized protein LOC131707094 isoform X2 n=1 Tax=Acipenser ruthenus TaxID=7906 RepID=UPI002740B7EB|nr:uncharacterized protein LOC131707094 isoform X2 [Acipenser ruthenus]
MKQQAWNPGALLVVILLGAVSFTLSDPFISEVSKGASATLYCNESLPVGSQAQWTRRAVSGDKRVIVTRQEDGRVVKEIKDLQNRFQIDDRFNIRIEKVPPEDLGTYECGGRETSLIVLADPASHTVSEGESVTLHCGDSAVLAGAGSVRWKQVNGGTDHPILYKDPAGKTVTQVNDPDHRYELRPDSSLYIRKVKSADSGRYECNGIHVADLKVLTATSTTTAAKTIKLTETTLSSESTTTTSKATAVSTTQSNKISSTAPSKQTTVLTMPPKKETATTTSRTTVTKTTHILNESTTVIHYVIYPVAFAVVFILGLLVCRRIRSWRKGFEGDTDYALVQLPKPADNDAENQQEPDYAVVMEPKISENENQENKDSDYALIQEPKVAEQNCPANIDSDYAVVDLNTDEKKAPDSKDSDYSLAQAPKVAVQETPTPKDSDYSLIQELEVSEQKSEDSKDSDYAVVQKPKVDKQKALDNKDSDYSLVQAPKDAEQKAPDHKDSDYFLVQAPKGTEQKEN